MRALLAGIVASGLGCEAADSKGTSASVLEPAILIEQPGAAETFQPLEGFGGPYQGFWRPSGHTHAPLNEHFGIELRFERDGVPATGLEIQIRGWMPEHGHGMLVQPCVEEIGEGRYRASPFLLHMRGAWTLHFDIVAEPEPHRLMTNLDL